MIRLNETSPPRRLKTTAARADLLRGNAPAGTVHLAPLLKRIHEITGRGALERGVSPLLACRIKEELSRRLSCAEPNGEESGEGASDSITGRKATESSAAAVTSSASSFLPGAGSSLAQEHVARQLATATSPETMADFELEPKRDPGSSATVFSLRPGPADVRSFHDFQDLQLAYLPTWSAIVDTDLRQAALALHEQMVEYDNQVSGGLFPPDRPLQMGTRKDLQQLVETARSFLGQYVASNSMPPELRARVPDLTDAEWNDFPPDLQAAIVQLFVGGAVVGTAADGMPILAPPNGDPLAEQLQELVRRARAASAQGGGPLGQLRQLMKGIEDRLNLPYRFDVFAPQSSNLGILLTYRQTWDPLDYQVGRLVSTIPLAPKETRKYSVKKTAKRTRLVKDLRDVEGKRSYEQTSTARADSEIVDSARSSTSFGLQTSSEFSVGVFRSSISTSLQTSAERSSQATKKNFHEAVAKSAEEYRQQHKLEIETNAEDTTETSTEGEISNPNDELTVTYMFYELQRQYRIREQLHRVEPVILVANELPGPDEIDDDWLLTNGWIVRRALLDRSLEPVLDAIDQSVAGDELALEMLRATVERHAKLLDNLTAEKQLSAKLSKDSFEHLRSLIDITASSDARADAMKAIATLEATRWWGPYGLRADKMEDLAQVSVERADKEVQRISAQLSGELSALQEAVDKYVDALRKKMDREVQRARLKLHVKENLLHYMQSIWDHEPTDQRYFRIYNVDVPWSYPPRDAVEIRVHPEPRGPGMPHVFGDSVVLELPPAQAPQIVWRKLHEVAELDRPLGYKGNYVVYALRESSYLHDYLMQDYVDLDSGALRDPDPFGEYSLDDLTTFACCLKRDDSTRYAEQEAAIKQAMAERLADPRGVSDIVVVPTDQLFIEALPGSHAILEHFKLVHRAMDVKKVAAEVRAAELENVRLAARLLESTLDDPNIEKLIKVEGASSVEVQA